MWGIADSGIDGNRFCDFGKKVRRDWNLHSNLPFAAHCPRQFFGLSVDGSGRHVATLSKESGEAEDEDGLSPKHENGAAASTSDKEASETEQIAAVVNLKRLAPVTMSN